VAPSSTPINGEPVDGYLTGLDGPQRATLEALPSPAAVHRAPRRGGPEGRHARLLPARQGRGRLRRLQGPLQLLSDERVRAGPSRAGGSGLSPLQGWLQFEIGSQLPVGLLRRLIGLRLAEISAVTTGRRYEYFVDGQVKATGPMKDGVLHGNWSWYRRDATLLRTGQFRLGLQVGTWTSYTADGTPARTTQY
jgi:hypothetical protein